MTELFLGDDGSGSLSESLADPDTTTTGSSERGLDLDGGENDSDGDRDSLPELKFEPDAVKTEIEEGEEGKPDYDPFLEECDGEDRAPPQRRLSQRKRTKIVKYEVEDDESDANEEACPTKRRRKATKEKKKQGGNCEGKEQRLKREGRRANAAAQLAIKEECDSDDQRETCETGTKIKSGRNVRRTKSSKKTSTTRRKPVSEMSEEEREMMKAKWREEARLKRQRQREQMTQEERIVYLARESERKRQLRQAKKESSLDKPPVKRKERRERGDSKEKRARALTEEERREEYQRRTLRRLERIAMMTEEEREEEKQKLAIRRMEKLAAMTQEELEEKKRRATEAARRRRLKMTEEEKAEKRERLKKYRQNMSPERRSQFLQRLKEAHSRRLDKLMKDPEKYAELKRKWCDDAKKRTEEMRELKKKATTGEVSRKELAIVDNESRRRGRGSIYANETVEERLIRLREQRRLRTLKASIKRRLRVQQMMDSGLSMEEIRQQTESPGQRERRLMRIRINRAKNRMQKRLEAYGVPPEDVQEELVIVEETYAPTRSERAYKPRVDRFKRVGEAELSLLESLEKKSDMSVKKSLVESQSQSFAGNQPPVQVVLQTTAQAQPSYFEDSIHSSSSSFEPQSEASAGQQCNFHVQSHQHYLAQSSSSQNDTLQWSSQPQSVQHFSLQHFIHPQSFPPLPQQAVSAYQHQPSHHHDYSSTASYGTHASSSYSAPSSPPPVNRQNSSDEVTVDNKVEIEPKVETNLGAAKELRPSRKMRQPRNHTNLPSYYKTGVPRGPKQKLLDKVKRDGVCDECGNSYKKSYLSEHKKQLHNPNFKDGRCVLCGVEFRKARDWYNHYRYEHLGEQRRIPKGLGQGRILVGREKDRRLSRNKQSEFDPKRRPYMCPQCGAAFARLQSLETHEYHMHGEGSKEENFYECPYCQKKLKRRNLYRMHIKKKHEGWKGPTSWTCERCKVVCSSYLDLHEHIRINHEDSYFPCKFCNLLRLSKTAWRFHTNRCPKISREQLAEMRREWKEKGEPDSVDKMRVPCEFCKKDIIG